MDESGAERRVGTAIAYPTLDQWASTYDLDVNEALSALRQCISAAYGPRVGLLNKEHRRQCLDLQRLVSVVDQMNLLGGGDVLAIAYRCPARMCRYDLALIQLIARAMRHGAPMRSVLIVERVHKLVSRLTEEVTIFYQGLS